MNFLFRVRKAHFDGLSTMTAVFGGPIFAYLLRRSKRAHARRVILWKGRMYSGGPGSLIRNQRAEATAEVCSIDRNSPR